MTGMFSRAVILRLLAVIGAIGLAMMALLPGGTAHAHPLGNFTVNRYARIEVYRDAVQIHYVLDIAEIPTFQLVGDVDRDGDGKASQAELDAYALKERERLAQNFVLTIAGKPAPVRVLDSDIALFPGQGSLQVTRFAVVYEAGVAAGISGDTRVTFVDHNYEDRAGWKEIVVRPSPGAQVTADPRLLADTSDALRSYSAETLRSAPDVHEAEFGWMAGSGSEAPAATIASAPGAQARASSGFAQLINHRRSASVIILSLLAAFGFGALHALGPGHGKTVVAAYLVGTRGTPKHAVALGLAVTATHTSTVYLLGFITLSASAFIVPETLYLYLGIVSGAMVVIMGMSLLGARLWRLYCGAQPGTHRHGLFGNGHSHETHDHASTGPHPAPDDHAHAHPQAATAQPAGGVTWRSLLTLGVAGGLIPCPSAIVVMLTAISLGQVFFGMLLIVAFSLGLAGVLTSIGIALTAGKRITKRFGVANGSNALFTRGLAALPIVSAFGVTLAGLAITYQAFHQPGL